MLLRTGQGGPVGTILRHFSLALQRFASLSDPGIEFCCLVEASCWLLAAVAGDARLAGATRQHAEHLLDMINSENCFQIGLTTDYMLECILHVRTVEVDNHDPARTPGVARELIDRLQIMFRDAVVAVRAPPGGPRMMTEIVMSQLAQSRAIHYNGRVELLYDATTKDSAKRAMARMNVVVDVVEKRLQADFSPAALESCVEGMLLVEWAEATTSAARIGVLKQCIRRLFSALRLDPVAGLKAFLHVVPHVIEHGKLVALRQRIEFRDLDFRDIWEIVRGDSLSTVQN